MKEYLLIIDGGTTKTSFTLLEHGDVCAQRTCKVGASASSESGKNIIIKQYTKNK